METPNGNGKVNNGGCPRCYGLMVWDPVQLGYMEWDLENYRCFNCGHETSLTVIKNLKNFSIIKTEIEEENKRLSKYSRKEKHPGRLNGKRKNIEDDVETDDYHLKLDHPIDFAGHVFADHEQEDGETTTEEELNNEEN
jgi:hypothetical protein